MPQEVVWEKELYRAEGAKGAVALRNGDVLVTRTGPVPGGVGVVCSISADEGRTWLRRGVIAYDPDPQTDIGDGCLLERRNGELLYSYRHNLYRGAHAEKPTYAIRIAVSRDDGRTWKPHSIVMEARPTGPEPSRGLWASFLFETSNDRLQCYYDDEYTPYAKGFRGHQWFQMKTWNPKSGAWENPVTVSRAHDPVLLTRDGMGSVVELPAKRLICAFESVQTAPPHGGLIRRVISDDGGTTWSWQKKERAVLYEPANRTFSAYAPSLTRLPRGLLLCVFATNEDREKPDKPGTPAPDLNLDIKYKLSYDNGRTWPGKPRVIYTETHKAYMPGIVSLKQGRVLALFLDMGKGYFGSIGSIAPRP